MSIELKLRRIIGIGRLLFLWGVVFVRQEGNSFFGEGGKRRRGRKRKVRRIIGIDRLLFLWGVVFVRQEGNSFFGEGGGGRER